MIFGLSLPTIIELVLALLLAPTLVCCFTLDQRLKALRKDQDNLNATVRALNASIAGAQASLHAVRAAAKETDHLLGAKLATARLLTDELSMLAASGERIAGRIESARDVPARASRGPSAAAANDPLRAIR